MSQDVIYDRLTKIIHDVFDDDTIIVGPTLKADDVDGWDSFAHLRLVTSVEKSFGVSFAASQIASLQNVGDLVKLIDLKVAKATP